MVNTLITISAINLLQLFSGGASWIQTSSPAAYWWSIASNSNGMYLAAVQYYYNNNGWYSPGYIYTSSNGLFFSVYHLFKTLIVILS